VATPPAVEVCMPIRLGPGLGGSPSVHSSTSFMLRRLWDCFSSIRIPNQLILIAIIRSGKSDDITLRFVFMSDLQELKDLLATETAEQKKRSFDIIFENFKAISKAQSRYVNGLISALALVWGWNLLSADGGVSVQFAGVTVKISGFWQVVPLVITLNVLALAGSVNFLLHSWRRLDLAGSAIGLPRMFFTEFDANKNLLDYFGALTWRIWRPILPESPASVPQGFEKWKVSLFLYPGLIVSAVLTTYHARWFLTHSWKQTAYLYVCLGLQAVFSLPMTIKKVGTFFGWHEREHDNLIWKMAKWK